MDNPIDNVGGSAYIIDMNTTTAAQTTVIYTIEKLPGKGEGWAIFDSRTNASIVGSRSKTRREAQEAADEMGIFITTNRHGVAVKKAF